MPENRFNAKVSSDIASTLNQAVVEDSAEDVSLDSIIEVVRTHLEGVEPRATVTITVEKRDA